MKKQILMLAALGMLASCQNTQKPTAAENGPAAEVAAPGTTIAYVDVDSLMKKYDFAVEYSEVLRKKAETSQKTLQNKEIALQSEAAKFQEKLEQGGFTSREQAEQAQNELQKKGVQLQNLQQSLAAELDAEQNKYNTALRDSLQNVLKEYNKTHKYTYIISKVGDNILLADERYDITDDVIKALNKRYKKAEK